MFKQLVLLAFCASLAYATMNLPTQEEYDAELKAAGMSQGGIDGLRALSQQFVSQYPIVQANKEAADKFLADYTVEVQIYVKSMSPEDQKIYADSLKKYGLA
ncbi:Protein CBG04677 [Caenorhabditis briggsae]|uniref:Protein CBG04677 n=1 Tax=Caenorhabditis briggsae TaxID=6238 RepID=A8WY76_CAEBR|nr:Protein CBG04677 [Caenorhabditis briggsae]CAP25334.1 Protein CBG04677 [Caenorhabditis briggsae]